ncbi:MAG: type IV secretory system conjugative DNA transfer family protein [Saccharofermentans sp.]|nr:type IV secretory system conjugative DNA transfer family protein [Saccharofermentans sp.]
MRDKRFLEKDQIREETSELFNGKKYNPGPVVYSSPDGEVRVDSSTRHIITYGITGSGKTTSGSLTEAYNTIKAGKSLIAIDPKGQLLDVIGNHVPKNYRKIVIDLTDPKHSFRFNIFSYITILLRSDKPEDKTIGFELLESTLDALFKESGIRLQDPFWDNSALNTTRAVFLALTTFLNDVNPITLSNHINGCVPMFHDEEDEDEPSFFRGSNIQTHLRKIERYIQGDDEVAIIAREGMSAALSNDLKVLRDIVSVINSHLTKFIGSGDMRKLHSGDDVNISSFNGKTPCAVFIVIPIHTHAYDKLAGIICNQFAQQLFRAASQHPDNRLPTETTFLLEEFGTIGKTIPLISELITAGRSYGIRIHLILQSYSQLIDLFGPAMANTLASNCSTTIFFRTLDYETYLHYGRICGMRQVDYGDHIENEPLITQDSLSALKTHQALVLMDDKVFCSMLPFYTSLYPELKK